MSERVRQIVQWLKRFARSGLSGRAFRSAAIEKINALEIRNSGGQKLSFSLG